ncbi:MAG: hypothetical protein ACOY94_18580 [Bacillota bacterium]
MQTKAPQALTCTLVEHLYLAALLGGRTLVGVPDPFTGWLAREVEEALRQARTSLESRSIIRQDPDGLLSVDPSLEQMVSVAVAPALTVALTHRNGQTSAQHLFYMADGQAVEQTYQPDTGTVSLSRLASPAQVVERIAELTGLERQGPAVLPGGLLPEGDWTRTVEAVRTQGTNQAGKVLAASGIPLESAAALCAALAAPDIMGQALVVAADPAEWSVSGVGYLAGDQGLWMLRQVTEKGQPWAEITPAPGEAVLAEIGRILERRPH